MALKFKVLAYIACGIEPESSPLPEGTPPVYWFNMAPAMLAPVWLRDIALKRASGIQVLDPQFPVSHLGSDDPNLGRAARLGNFRLKFRSQSLPRFLNQWDHPAFSDGSDRVSHSNLPPFAGRQVIERYSLSAFAVLNH